MGKVRYRLQLFRGPQPIVLLVAVTMFFSGANPTNYSPVFATTKRIDLPAIVTISPTTPTSNRLDSRSPTADATPHQNDVPRIEMPRPLKLLRIDCDMAPCIVLSFDDGPNVVTTPKMLDILEQAHVTASFFVVGKNIAGNEALLQRMAKDGMEIGNHTWSHMDLTKLTPAQIRDELIKTQLAVQAAGAPLPTLFRPPYGAVDDVVVGSAGLQTALWNEDPKDWKVANSATLQQIILASAKPGGVIDLHDIHQVTVDAMASTILSLKGSGYQFVTVSQLQNSKARPGNAPFYGYKSDMFRHHN